MHINQDNQLSISPQKTLYFKIKFWTTYIDKNIFNITGLIHEKLKQSGNKSETDRSSFFIHSEWNAEGRQTQNGEKSWIRSLGNFFWLLTYYKQSLVSSQTMIFCFILNAKEQL